MAQDPAPGASRPPTPAAPAHTLELLIVSLAGEEWRGTIREVSLPGSEGRFGVMARHAPLLATLVEGNVHVLPAQGPAQDFYVSGGYVEVQPDKVMVMADLAARGRDRDHARTEAARERAISPMAANFTDEAYAKAHAELAERYRGKDGAFPK